MIPHLGQETLSLYLKTYALPPARFLSEPATHFDSALVPLQAETPGSGYVLYLTDTLTVRDIYTLFVHAYGHLAYGHLRQGDTHSHYDRLDDLQSPFGPSRRWDQTIQNQQHLWFQPPSRIASASTNLEHEWFFASFARAFERLQKEECDDFALTLQAFAARHGDELIQTDFNIAHNAELFPHQKRGAAELVVRLQKLGVALLADSVGLGKTRTVAATIQLLCQAKIITRAAILAPAKLHHNWLAELHKLQLTVSTDAEKMSNVLLLNKDIFKRHDPREARKAVQSCQLLVIEEAHQDLRNVDNKFHRNLREAALDKYGILVTATPWNNRRADIFAMLQPFASNHTGSDRPAHLFACFTKSLKAGQEEFEQDNTTFQHLYNRTTLQRTRRQLRESGDTSVFYAPRRPYLVGVPYTSEQQHSFTTLLGKIEQLYLPSYNPVRRLTSADSSENRLSGIHRFQLLKRAESSMYAFATSLQKLADKARTLQHELSALIDTEAAMSAWLYRWYEIEEAESHNEPKLRPGKQGRTRKLIDKAEKEGRLRALRTLLLDDCRQDIQLIQTIQHDFAPLFARDPKVEIILQKIQQNVAKGQKVLCISADADTAYTVYRAAMGDPLLKQKGIGFLTSSEKEEYAASQINGLKASREAIFSRFAPRSWSSAETKGKTNKDKQPYPKTLDLLIGSDTLSVGQNLQDARVLLNLDLCWNPMQHEQRIGRIDRPRHKEDSEPLDIYYFLNLDLIEAELALRKRLEERLTSTYQDTAFDDVIFPGYFDMIEQFRRLRKEKENDHAYIADADALLEEIAERSARPSADAAAENERERAALHRLLELAHDLAPAEETALKQQLVNIGRIPYDNWQSLSFATRPDAALVAEVRFQPLDQRKHAVGKATYQHIYMNIYEEEKANPKINLDDASLVPVIEGFLAETSRIPLRKSHISHLQAMLVKLEEYVQQTLENHQTLLKRQARYQQEQNDLKNESTPLRAQYIEANLINIRFLI
ncbi:hypothetical protein KSC_001620 [Ktedonobacter sp. SOSP1-52]|nr:hypothetical protein KSC_001620 [Ktedonobacter sp. SOSP1-52]